MTSCLLKMADTSVSDGVENQESVYEGSGQQSHVALSPVTPDAPPTDRLTPDVAQTDRLTPQTHRDRDMDGGDGDGAPSYPGGNTDPLSSPRQHIGEGHKGQGDMSGGESTPRRDGKPSTQSTTPRSPRPSGAAADLSGVDMKSSWSGSAEGSAKAGMLADPAKIAKEREKEERVRQARQKLMEERRKKLEELREQQRIAQENREKQLEMRRRKIEDLRRRDVERRQAVEERRKMKEEMERVRRESILQKAEERLARYEAWKAGGRKDRSKTRGAGSRRESRDRDSVDGQKTSPRDGGDTSQTGRKDRKVRSSSFFERLSTPKFQKSSQETLEGAEKSPRKETPQVRRSSLKERPTFTKDSTAPGPSTPKSPAKRNSIPGKDKDSTPRPSTSKDGESTSKPAPSKQTAKTKEASRPASAARAASPAAPKSGTSTPRVTPPPSNTSTPTHTATPQTEQDGGSVAAAAPRSHQDITAEEYKARLAEKRRQAREKAEREAEEERKRLEEERLAEEERERQEEEEQRRQDEETMRLAAQAREAEEERLQRAIEAEERRKKEESDRMEQERKQKEEADRKAKEEAEKLEKEKQERMKREEEERIQRKKKLEMIMKRVKPTDSPTVATDKPVNGSSSAAASPSQNSPEETSKPITEPATTAPPVVSDGDTEPPREAIPSGMSASTDNLGVSDDVTARSASASPVPRSASIGNILEETSAVDAPDSRMTSSMISTPTRAAGDSESDSKPKFKSPLLQSLVEKKGGDSSNSSPKFKSPLLNSLLGKNKAGSARMALSASMDNLSPRSGASSPTSEKEISKAGRDEDKDEDTTSNHNGGMADSALGTSVMSEAMSQSESQSATVTNGHSENKEGLVDSSISLHSPQGQSSSPANGGTDGGQFEEIIDLIDGQTKSNGKLPGAAPIIAFDQNSHVTESLS